jgi:leucyl/phenylalanyl-tRNA--protein transferase
MVAPERPVEPDGNRWSLPDPREVPDGVDLAGVGADLEPGTLLAAYRSGLFPMHVDLWDERRLGWWSPDPRGVLPVGGAHAARSLRRSARGMHVTLDESFGEVIAACAREHDGEAWILPEFEDAYAVLFELGWAHSIEVRDADGTLIGGLYGVAIGGLFAGESMFHRVRDASKVAMLALSQIAAFDGDDRRLIDVQWKTPHLASMGVVEVPRADYLRRLAMALEAPQWSSSAIAEVTGPVERWWPTND